MTNEPEIITVRTDNGATATAAFQPLPFEQDILGKRSFRLQDFVCEPDAITDQTDLIRQFLDRMAGDGFEFGSCRFPADTQPLNSDLIAAGFQLIEQLDTLQLDLTAVGEATVTAGVRTAEAADAEACTAIARTAFQHDRFHQDPLIDDDRASALKAAWVGNNVTGRADRTFLAVEGDRVVGFNSCLKRGTDAVIDLIAIDPAYHGRGLGKNLVRAAINHYQASCRTLTVGTQSENRASQVLYQACGFKKIDESWSFHCHTSVD